MASKKILIIDDDPNVTKLLKAKLESLDGIITEVTNAPADAVQLAQNFLPDLIICDIDMGEAWGGEVAQDIARNPATAKIPLIFLSSMVTPGDMTRQSGGRKLISKKMPIKEIIDAIIKEISPA